MQPKENTVNQNWFVTFYDKYEEVCGRVTLENKSEKEAHEYAAARLEDDPEAVGFSIEAAENIG
jgi:hypothetical protein